MLSVGEPLTVGSLFSGIGGFDLGLERAGMRTVWFCEQDAYCQRVLARHWPGVPCYPDIGDLRGEMWTPTLWEMQPAILEPVDVLAGGFPCQDISIAGQGAGIDGAKSGLWRQFARLVGELRPSYVIVENVSALRRRGLDVVVGDLAALGYDAEWDCIPAASVGAPHYRDRIWIVAYPCSERRQERRRSRAVQEEQFAAQRARQDCRYCAPDEQCALCAGPAREFALRRGELAGVGHSHWLTEPDVGRLAHGIPARVDRLRSLGNALVPQIAEWIGRRIVAYERERLSA